MKHLERFCWVTGIVLLAWFCAIKVQAHVFQTRQSAELIRVTADVPPIHRNEDNSDVENSGPTVPLIGRIQIPRLRVASVIEEGDDAPTLRTAVGHIPGTSMPGEEGNVGLAGHRDTLFRALAKVTPGDVIVLTTHRGTFHYRVETTGIVSPNQVSILRAVGVPTLTLVTCYPFYYVGPAPNRYVVSAFLSDQSGTTADKAQELGRYGN